jgi:hypothetical protein
MAVVAARVLVGLQGQADRGNLTYQTMSAGKLPHAILLRLFS